MKKIKCSSSFPRVLSKEAYIAHLLRRSWRYRTVGDRIVEGKDNMRIRREIFWETMEIDHVIILMLLRIYHRDAYSFLVFIFILKIESRLCLLGDQSNGSNFWKRRERMLLCFVPISFYRLFYLLSSSLPPPSIDHEIRFESALCLSNIRSPGRSFFRFRPPSASSSSSSLLQLKRF